MGVNRQKWPLPLQELIAALLSCSYPSLSPWARGLKQAAAATLFAVSLLPGVVQVVSVTGEFSRETSFQSAEYRLKGTLTSPVGQSAVGGVLIIPGSGPVNRDGASQIAPSLPPVYRQWAEQLSKNGFVVLRYDKRFLTYPDLDISSFDQAAQITDALSALAFLSTCQDWLNGPSSSWGTVKEEPWRSCWRSHTCLGAWSMT